MYDGCIHSDDDESNSCMNEFIVSVGINKEMKACPQHALAYIQSAIYYRTKTQPRSVAALRQTERFDL